MKVVNKIKEEKGAATIVEASIVFPIVFLIVCFHGVLSVRKSNYSNEG